MKQLGVVGTMVWDTIHDRDPAQRAIEEWGGIAYALEALDATLPDDWAIVPLIKVGRDLSREAATFLREIHHVAPGARFIEVPEANNRVTLRYESSDRRCERVTGGVPGWTWPELGPLVRDLDALYVNFIAGWEMTLETAQLLRRGFARPMYADLHSLFLGRLDDGTRVLQPLPGVAGWFSCFDTVQLNEDEFSQVSPDPMTAAALALGTECRSLIVTLGPRGAVYFVTAGSARGGTGPVRTARIGLDPGDAAPPSGGDPTGCGDVFGAVACARLLTGTSLEDAVRSACHLASRNVTYRGARGLRDHLLGRLASV
ncbi:MAG TPA: carbohydrate kinase family protein [Gemmatimonadales bacterium]|nr:carbohydrate kinase family protein [Gemmatimonadales bacterium]